MNKWRLGYGRECVNQIFAVKQFVVQVVQFIEKAFECNQVVHGVLELENAHDGVDEDL